MDMLERIFNIVTGENPLLWEFALPFALLYFAFYIGLSASKTIEKRFRKVISVIISLLIVLPHFTGSYPPCWDVVDILIKVLPQIGYFIIAIVALLLVLGFVFSGNSIIKDILHYVGFIMFFFAIWLFISSRGGSYSDCPGSSIFNFLNTDFGMTLLVVILIVFAIVVFFRGMGKSLRQT